MKINTKVVHQVEYSDMERFVSETYGKRYSFVASEECGNDSSHSYAVRKKEALDEWDQRDLKLFIERPDSECLRARLLLQDMVNKDLIPTGDYVIRVSW